MREVEELVSEWNDVNKAQPGFAGFRDRREVWVKESGWPPEVGKDKKTVFYRASRKEQSPANNRTNESYFSSMNFRTVT